MKHFIILLLTAFLLTSITSCSDAEKLEKLTEELTEQCPITFGEAGTLTRTYVQDSTVVFTLLLNDKANNMQMLADYPFILKHSSARVCNMASGKLKEIVGLVKKMNYNFMFTYTGENSGKTLTSTLTVKDLEHEKSPVSSAPEMQSITKKETEEQAKVTETVKFEKEFKQPKAPVTKLNNNKENVLTHRIASIKVLLPKKLDDITTMTDIKLDRNYVVVDCELDEKILRLESLKKNPQVLRQIIKENLSTKGTAQADLANTCSNTEKGLAYRYTGSETKEHCIVFFNNEELKTLQYKE